jgi:hypothetical protein
MRVKCTLPNASGLINGIVFTPCDGGVISAEIDAVTAAQFLGINGYSAVETSGVDSVEPEPIEPPRKNK